MTDAATSPSSDPTRTATTRTADPALPAAVLWDMDGTLVDTEPYWIAQEQALVESYGGTWTQEDAHALVGSALLDSAEYIRTHSPVDLPHVEIVERLQSGVIEALADHVPWRPGARELLTELGELGVPCALVTMSWRPMVDALLSSLPVGTFAAVVTGDEVEVGKPDPAPYLLAARMLGLPPGECVAIEDSVTGARSAAAAGTRALAVPHVVDVPAMPGLHHADTLVGVHAADLLPLTS